MTVATLTASPARPGQPLGEPVHPQRPRRLRRARSVERPVLRQLDVETPQRRYLLERLELAGAADQRPGEPARRAVAGRRDRRFERAVLLEDARGGLRADP